MSKQGSIVRGEKWAFYMGLSEKDKTEILESMKKFPAMKEDYENYLASLKTSEKKK